jgi:outer membrane lipoprotein SlyB
VTMPGQTSPVALTVKGCTNANITVGNIQAGGATLPNQSVTSARPVVLEMGEGTNLIRVGGSEVPNVAPN